MNNEIEVLKQIIDANNLNQNIGQFVKPANEPVAYVNSMCNDYIDWKIDPMSIDGQSLYTHPAKTLTDEEINDLIFNKVTDADMIREALRKAQQK
jgi:hypothetical protein